MYYVKDKYEDDTILVASSLSDETFKMSIDEARNSDKEIAGVGAKSITVYSDIEKFVAMMNMRIRLAGVSTSSFMLEYGRLAFREDEEQCYVKATNFIHNRGNVVEVPRYVDALEAKLFGCALGIDRVILHDNIVALGYGCFEGSSIQEIDIPSKVTQISNAVFSLCSNLKRVSLPSSVKVIGYSAFDACNALIEINLPDGLTEIANFAFTRCSSLVFTSLPKSLVSLGTASLPQVCGEFDLPSIQDIGARAFRNSQQLRGVTTGEKLVSLGSGAFWLSGVEHVDMSRSECLLEIREDTFTSCTKLKQINLPDSVQKIGDKAFSLCTKLSEFKFPSSLIKIGVEAFKGCPLTRIEFGNAVTTIGSDAFAQCTKVEEIIFPDSLETIGACAFMNCYNLSSISLPASIKKISELAFSYTNLKKVYLRGGGWSGVEMTDAFDEGVEFIRV